MRRLGFAAVVVVALALVGCGAPVDPGTGDVGQVTDMARAAAPTGKNLGTILTAANHAKTKITYHNGPVLSGSANVYFIWYGDWSNKATAQQIVTDFASNVGLSPWFQLNTRYPDGSGQATNGVIFFGGATSDAYSHGPTLSDADLASVVQDQLTLGALPQDPAGIYVVLGSADVTASSGFCSAYCGQHSSTSFNGSTIRTVFVGNADRCPTSCMPQAVGPNGDGGADAMVNALANELSTTVTDPTLNAWYDRDGFENADKCAWTFGTTYTAANGALANVHLGTRDFLIQRNWFPTSKGGVCVMNATQAAAAIAAGQDDLGGQ